MVGIPSGVPGCVQGRCTLSRVGTGPVLAFCPLQSPVKFTQTGLARGDLLQLPRDEQLGFDPVSDPLAMMGSEVDSKDVYIKADLDLDCRQFTTSDQVGGGELAAELGQLGVTVAGGPGELAAGTAMMQCV